MHFNTAQAIAALRHGVKPTLDQATQEMVKADIRKFYGFDWPAGADWDAGIKALGQFLIDKHKEK